MEVVWKMKKESSREKFKPCLLSQLIWPKWAWLSWCRFQKVTKIVGCSPRNSGFWNLWWGRWFQLLLDDPKSASFKAYWCLKAWLTVGIPVHPKGVGWSRGQGPVQGSQVLQQQNLENYPFVYLALCTGELWYWNGPSPNCCHKVGSTLLYCIGHSPNHERQPQTKTMQVFEHIHSFWPYTDVTWGKLWRIEAQRGQRWKVRQGDCNRQMWSGWMDKLSDFVDNFSDE